MSLNQIAQDYVTYVKEGQFIELLDRLYAQDAVSVEPAAMPGQSRHTEGIEALRTKSREFDHQHEIHNQTLQGPWPHGEEKFAVHMTFEMTHLESGHQSRIDEIAVLTVRQGKIVREEFFYQV